LFAEVLGQLVSDDGMSPETADPESGEWLSRHWFGWPGAARACVLSAGDLRPQPATSLTSHETIGRGA
jgi:hypothetical protein